MKVRKPTKVITVNTRKIVRNRLRLLHKNAWASEFRKLQISRGFGPEQDRRNKWKAALRSQGHKLGRILFKKQRAKK